MFVGKSSFLSGILQKIVPQFHKAVVIPCDILTHQLYIIWLHKNQHLVYKHKQPIASY